VAILAVFLAPERWFSEEKVTFRRLFRDEIEGRIEVDLEGVLPLKGELFGKSCRELSEVEKIDFPAKCRP